MEGWRRIDKLSPALHVASDFKGYPSTLHSPLKGRSGGLGPGAQGELLDEYRAMNFEELRATLEARNELRRQSQPPLLVEKELKRQREDER